MKRWLLVGMIALGLAPGTFVRTPKPPSNFTAGMDMIALDLERRRIGAVEVSGIWQLRSENDHFGGYSALVALDDTTLLAGSDRGRFLRLTAPGPEAGRTGRMLAMGYYAGGPQQDKHTVDLESLTRDPASGTIWGGYEDSNTLERRDAALGSRKAVRPEAMRGWSANSGAESLVRLADGRFLAISEGVPDGETGHPALLFAGDPVATDGAAAGAPIEFTFTPPTGYRPVDAEQLPDGPVLVLVRRVDWGLPPRFATALVLADPTEIEAGKAWRGQVVARFDPPLPTDNFEGLALSPEPAPGDRPILWMISDDNGGEFQRTLLYRMEWLSIEPPARPRINPRPPAARKQ
ncbi:hypothetical protein HME9302_02428 [Alteripontixanthobacter maritimus]|uniref:Phytase-like domain-containing protein n=1 Tax=Alteripontixanthobacter maritimus TaxID=2161824 RepID=A0A369QE68_9SPHN|nr:esterase-like activity of phytase family protein [Alteripontixanthobacter maritimus]RDC61209.1 hypothetical protein HME9302_02428 [Alteripontixanthobacter maritimus]